MMKVELVSCDGHQAEQNSIWKWIDSFPGEPTWFQELGGKWEPEIPVTNASRAQGDDSVDPRH